MWRVSAPHRRLVLVLDDLDRFQDEDREDARSVLRSLHRLTSGTKAVDGLWVVVPERPPDLEDPGAHGVSEWMDKLYVARFAVPPPLPNASREHLERLLAQAFPDHPVTIRQETARAWLRAGRASVPRRSVQFVNDLVVLYRQHGDARVPLPAQAAYLASGAPLGLGDDDRHDLERALRVPDWLSIAAALHYGLPPDRAVEVHLTGVVSKAIASGTSGWFQTLPDRHVDAACHVAYETVHTLALGRAAHLVDNAAWALSDVPDHPLVNRAWQILLEEAPHVTEWTTVHPEQGRGRGLGLLLARSDPDSPDLRHYIDELNRPIAHPEERGRILSSQRVDSRGRPLEGSLPTPSAEDLSAWAAVVGSALSTAFDAGLSVESLGLYRLPGTTETYIQAVRAVAERSRLALPPLRSDAGPVEVVGHLTRDASGPNQTAGLSASVSALLDVHETWDWTPLVDQALSRLASGPMLESVNLSLSFGDVQELLAVLLFLAHHPRSSARDEATAAFSTLDAHGGLLDLAQVVARSPAPHPESDLALRGTFALAALLYADLSSRVAKNLDLAQTARVEQLRRLLRSASALQLRGLAERFNASSHVAERAQAADSFRRAVAQAVALADSE